MHVIDRAEYIWIKLKLFSVFSSGAVKSCLFVYVTVKTVDLHFFRFKDVSDGLRAGASLDQI